jgi:hypothetical protein
LVESSNSAVPAARVRPCRPSTLPTAASWAGAAKRSPAPG